MKWKEKANINKTLAQKSGERWNGAGNLLKTRQQ